MPIPINKRKSQTANATSTLELPRVACANSPGDVDPSSVSSTWLCRVTVAWYSLTFGFFCHFDSLSRELYPIRNNQLQRLGFQMRRNQRPRTPCYFILFIIYLCRKRREFICYFDLI